eukprot:3245117-Pyramimonas_sp.AAC.2
MEPNTVLINFYKENAEFKWHRDPSVMHPRHMYLCGRKHPDFDATKGWQVIWRDSQHAEVVTNARAQHYSLVALSPSLGHRARGSRITFCSALHQNPAATRVVPTPTT